MFIVQATGDPERNSPIAVPGHFVLFPLGKMFWRLLVDSALSQDQVVNASNLRSHGLNKIECWPPANLSGSVKCNTLAYWAHPKLHRNEVF